MILIVTPALPETGLGNGITAERWRRILVDLGHDVTIAKSYQPGEYTALIALHAVKSAGAIAAFREHHHPTAPVVLALTGTDVYPDLDTAGVDPATLDAATRLVVLQEDARERLPPPVRDRTHVIMQSVPAVAARPGDHRYFDVVVLAHLRAVKDPLRPALAAQLLPADSRIRVRHAGDGLDPALAEQARSLKDAGTRYEWLGPVSHVDALDLLAGSDLLVLTSWHEGGANVVSEALAADVPVLCTEIPGLVGMLGRDYPGYVPAGDTAALAGRLRAAESDPAFYAALREHGTRRRALIEPDRERQAWRALLAEIRLEEHIKG